MSEMRLTFHGAVGGQVTGSMHLLECAGGRFLFDAGLYQGRRAEADKLNRSLTVDPRTLNAVVLSHAHIDHSGRLPLLVREGYHAPIYATPATRDLCAVMLADSAEIQERDAEHLRRHGKTAVAPLYTGSDAVQTQELMIGLPYHRPFYLRRNLSFEFTDAGHILGSASVDLRFAEGPGHRLVFSGDIGRWGLPVIRDPEPPSGPVDTLIIESTYAARDHESVADSESRLGEAVARTAKRGGKVLIPSFAVGRTQELVYALHELWRAGRIPEIPVYIDSPLAIDATQVFRMHPEVFDRKERLAGRTSRLFDFPLVRYTRSVEESKKLNTLHGPAVIIAASGMCEAGRILHHLAHGLGDHRNLVLFVGFQADHTLGFRIQRGDTTARIYGDDVDVRAEIETIGGYSAHADRTELRQWVKRLGGPIKRAFVVHGEDPAREAMRTLLASEGVGEVVLPNAGDSFQLQ
ncbi:MAG TPA: MBL fold metallo-hydrolase [Gemmatimonadales bacterium]|nr:MBL fold metallo-hydrolase [Gemmatimonadales bacterium]